MFGRESWLVRLDRAWNKRSIVWLSGARRVGKTTLARMVDRCRYINCDLPSDVLRVADPELFLRSLVPGSPLVLDEIHRLDDPSRLLKIAADAFPHVRVLATGSSTLAATRKFRDSLTGRKQSLYLPPVLWAECKGAVGLPDLDRRLVHGGMPEQLLAATPDPEFFAEWLDSYYARDIQELFGVRNRAGFLKVLYLVLRQSGGSVQITRIAKHAGLSRPTVMSHLDALAVAHACFVVPPFAGGGRREITSQPRLYAFDTGFVVHARGWRDLRQDDRGGLWEHLVLDHLRTIGGPAQEIRYWRDKSGREIDFVLPRRGGRVDTIECKISAKTADARSLRTFRAAYPDGDDYLAVPGIDEPFRRRVADREVIVCDVEGLPGQDSF